MEGAMQTEPALQWHTQQILTTHPPADSPRREQCSAHRNKLQPAKFRTGAAPLTHLHRWKPLRGMSHLEWFLFVCYQLFRHISNFTCLQRSNQRHISFFFLYWWLKLNLLFLGLLCVKKIRLTTLIQRMYSDLWSQSSPFLHPPPLHCNTPTHQPQRQCLNKGLLFPQINFTKGLYTGIQTAAKPCAWRY